MRHARITSFCTLLSVAGGVGNQPPPPGTGGERVVKSGAERSKVFEKLFTSMSVIICLLYDLNIYITNNNLG